MFGKNKEPKEKPKYTAKIGTGGESASYYDVFEYRMLDSGIVELRTNCGVITLMPGTPCIITGGKWNPSSE